MRALLLVLLLLTNLLAACQPIQPEPIHTQASAPQPAQAQLDAEQDSGSNVAGLQALQAAIAAAPALTTTAAVRSVLAQDVSAESIFLILYPELGAAPAPRWLRTGLRVTYNFGYATAAEGPDDRVPAGSGLLQYDVIAQDTRTVVLLPTVISTATQGQPPAVLPPAHERPGVGAFWFAPEVLATAEQAAVDRFDVGRLTTTVEGVDYDLVRMQSTGERSEEVWAFEAGTGLLVYYRQTRYKGDGSQESGSYLTLLGERRVRVPWRRGAVPTWAQRGVELHYSGSQYLDLGGPPYTMLPLTMDIRITRAGATWTEHTQQPILSGQPLARTLGATGVSQLFGGLWLPPEARAALETGAVLDVDPLTEIETRADRVDARVVILTAEGPSYLTRLTYDARTGRLIGLYQEGRMLAGTLITELVSGESHE